MGGGRIHSTDEEISYDGKYFLLTGRREIINVKFRIYKCDSFRVKYDLNPVSALRLFACIPPELEISNHAIGRLRCNTLVDAFLPEEYLRDKVL